MRWIAVICLVTGALVGCASPKVVVHTHEPGVPQDTYEPQNFESKTPGD